MHDFRSHCKNNLKQEGFSTYEVMNNIQPLKLAPTPVNMEQYINTIDSNLTQLNFVTRLFIICDKEKALQANDPDQKCAHIRWMSRDGSIIRLFLDNAIIDSKGSYVDFRSFFV